VDQPKFAVLSRDAYTVAKPGQTACKSSGSSQSSGKSNERECYEEENERVAKGDGGPRHQRAAAIAKNTSRYSYLCLQMLHRHHAYNSRICLRMHKPETLDVNAYRGNGPD
jgi:hypothetical protein